MDLLERKSSMSLDVLGAWDATVEKLRAVIPTGMNVRFVEAIGLAPSRQLRPYITKLENHGFTVSEIHGPTGADGQRNFIDELRLRGMHLFFVPPKELISQFPDQEILVHTPIGKRSDVRDAFEKVKPRYAWIENHNIGDAGLVEAGEIVTDLRARGVSCGVMFDGGHHIGPSNITSPRDFPKAWDRMLRAMNDHGGTITGVHVPVGTVAVDAFPLDTMNDTMLKEYASALPQSVRTVTVENQQEGKLLFLPKSDIAEVQRRNGRIFEQLQKAGIVDFS